MVVYKYIHNLFGQISFGKVDLIDFLGFGKRDPVMSKIKLESLQFLSPCLPLEGWREHGWRITHSEEMPHKDFQSAQQICPWKFLVNTGIKISIAMSEPNGKEILEPIKAFQ